MMGSTGGYGGYGGGSNLANNPYNSFGNGMGMGSTTTMGNSYGGDQGAGGFMSNTNDALASTNNEGGKKRNRSAYIPIAIRQITTAKQNNPEAPLMFDSFELTNVTFVAKVMSTSGNETNVQYTVEDGTGQIDIRQFESNDEGSRRTPVSAGTYVRVYGSVKIFANKRGVNAVSVRPINDANEITFHMTDVLLAYNVLTRGAPSTVGSASGPVLSNDQTHALNSSAYAAPRQQDMFNAQNGDLDVLQTRVVQVYRNASHLPDGLATRDVVQELRAYASEMEIRQAIEFLQTEGHLYSTFDDEHYRATV